MSNEPSFGLIEVLLGFGLSVGGWFAKVVWEKIGRIERSLGEIQSEFHDRYVRRDDYRNDITEIKAGIERIYQKLDSKADKP